MMEDLKLINGMLANRGLIVTVISKIKYLQSNFIYNSLTLFIIRLNFYNVLNCVIQCLIIIFRFLSTFN